jgi:hypothetical protein
LSILSAFGGKADILVRVSDPSFSSRHFLLRRANREQKEISPGGTNGIRIPMSLAFCR